MKRIEPGFVEGFFQYLLFIVPYGIVWLFVAAYVEHFGGPQLAATLIACVIVWILINPLLFKLSYFECKQCGHVCRHTDVVCKGVGFVI
jgi:hypothetical protein